MSVLLEILVFRDFTPFRSACSYRRFGRL